MKASTVKPQSKSEKTRLRILDGAARTFRDKGYGATRLTDIASAAHIQAGSLYYHFDSKEQMLDEVLARGHGRVFDGVRGRIKELGGRASYRERLRAAIRVHLETNLEHDDYAAANLRLHNQIPPSIRRRHIGKHRAYAAYWQELLEDAQAAGEIGAGVDVSLARLNLFGMMNWAMEWYRPGRLPVGELAENMCRTFFDGIGQDKFSGGLAPSAQDPADMDEIMTRLGRGDVRACARLISRIERGEDLTPLLQALYHKNNHASCIGVTGPPGAGKSSLISRLVGIWRGRGLSVAILAVDPSSPITGGALLGDRLRMGEHGVDEGVFIRSMAARGELGGLAKAAGDALTVLQAMDWDMILIETVGVGQNETRIMDHASISILLQTPMGGDEVQAGKAGVTEIADLIVVNKSDHPDADQTVRQLKDMISLGQSLNPERRWQPPVIKTNALKGEGAGELADQIERFFDHLAAHPEEHLERQRLQARRQAGFILHELLERRLVAPAAEIDRLTRGEGDPYELAWEIYGKG